MQLANRHSTVDKEIVDGVQSVRTFDAYQEEPNDRRLNPESSMAVPRLHEISGVDQTWNNASVASGNSCESKEEKLARLS